MNMITKRMALWLGMASVTAAQAATVVKLQFDPVGTIPTINTTRTPDVDITNQQYTINWSDSALFFDGNEAWNQDAYAGVSFTCETNNLAAYSVALEDGTGSNNDYIRFTSTCGSTNIGISTRVIALWDSATFLTNGFKVFDTRPESAIKYDFSSSSPGIKAWRMVFREAGQYYVSSLGGASASMGTFDGAQIGLKWATFDPNAFTNFNPSTFNATNGTGMTVGTFTNKVFTNIDGVGFMIDAFRANIGIVTELEIKSFEVNLMDVVGVPPAPVNALVVSLDANSITNDIPTPRTADVNTTAARTYEWDPANPMFTVPSTPNIPIYGGSHITDPTAVPTNSLSAPAPSLSTALLGTGKGIKMNSNNKPAADTWEARHILLWDSADFLVNGYNTFSNSVDCSLSMEFDANTGKQCNFILRDGDTYYVSDVGSIASGLQTFAKNGTQILWAPFDPANFKAFVNSSPFGVATNGTFLSRTFTNVTGVGVISYQTRAALNPTLFQVRKMDVRLLPNAGVETDGFTLWAESYLPDDVSDPEGDFDGDGVKNLAEYAINGNPIDDNNKGLTSSRLSGANFLFVHNKLVNDSSVTYRLIDTTDLVFGTAAATNSYTGQTLGPVVGAYQTVTNTYDTGATQKFIELEVEK